MAETPLRVAVLPEYTDNPYQRRLIDSMPAGTVEAHWHDAEPRWLPSLERFVPDVAHFHWLDPYVLSGPFWKAIAKSWVFRKQLRALRERGVATVWTCHNLVNHAHRHPRLERRAIRATVNLFDRVIVHDASNIEPVAETFGVKGRGRFAVIPHAAFGDVYPAGASREETRRALGIDSGAAVLMMFGALQPRKRVLEVIRAFGRIADPSARLLVVGRGKPDYVAELRSAAATDTRVTLDARFVDNAEVRPLHDAADAVLLPYGTALTSGALTLAMELGKPVACSPFGHAQSMLGDSTDGAGDAPGGVFFAGGDEDALAAGMTELLRRRADWPAIGERNRRRATEQTWATMAEQTLACYRDAIAERNG